MGLRGCFAAASAPAASVRPSMIAASSSWPSSALKTAPWPALNSGESSITTTAASTASRAEPPVVENAPAGLERGAQRRAEIEIKGRGHLGAGQDAAAAVNRKGDGHRSWLIVEVAGGQALRRDRAQERALDTAAVEGARTARMEMTARRRGKRRGQFAADRLEADVAIVVEDELGHGVEQRLGVGMVGLRVDLLRFAELDDAAEIHDGDAVAHMAHHAQIVADEQAGEIELAAQLQEQIEDLRLDGDIEGGHRLVADQQIGLHGQRAGDGDALALAARELMRIPVGEIGVETDTAEPLRHVLARDRAW